MFDIRVSVHRWYDFVITTNKMQLFLIIYFWKAVHDSGGGTARNMYSLSEINNKK